MSAIASIAIAAVAFTALAQAPAQSLYDQATAAEAESGRAAVEAASKGAAAVQLYIQAARAGNGKAARRLSEIYETGIEGVPRNYAESLKWRNQARALGEDMPAAKHGAAGPMPSSAVPNPQTVSLEPARALEAEGKGPEAVKLYIRLARAGNGMAAYRLGEIYDKGIPGVPTDPAESKKWFNAAKVLGYPPTIMCSTPICQQALALEMEGRSEEAVKLYIRAARSGDGQAAKRLGEIYDKGIPGVNRDYAESLKWYNAARVLGEEVPMAKSR